MASRARTLTSAEIAWIALAPCALIVVAAIVLLGPPLGHVLFNPGSDALWPRGWWETEGHPEPTKHGRYLLAVLGALLLPAIVLASARHDLRLRPLAIRAILFASYALLLAFVAVALLNQDLRVDPSVPPLPNFSAGTVVIAALLVLGALAALRNSGVADRLAQLARETSTRRWAYLAIAIAFSAIWLLKALKTDRVPGDLQGWNLNWTLNDAFAVLNGRTPLVDYHLIYAKLLPYPAALAMAVFGANTFVYSALMAVLNGLALLAVYAIFRLVTRSSLYAIALFVPFVAMSDPDTFATPAGVISPLTLPAMWPMRYGGAFLLAWLTARYVAGRAPRRAWVLFFTGGLVLINSLEFGIGAVLATAVVLVCAHPPRSANAALRLAAHAAGGTLAAIAVVALATLSRAGAFPDPALFFEWPRIFTNLGWFSLPMPTLGLHLAIYATFAASIAAAAVRLSRAAEDILLTSMLAWSGVFGLLAGSYFMGRPDAYKLDGMFSAWAFTLALLTVVALRSLSARRWRNPALPELLVLFGFGLAICSISQIALPQERITRLADARQDAPYLPTAERFVREHTRTGETVAILLPMSFRIAHDLGLRNVAPYGFMNAIVTRPQLQTLIDVLREEHVDAVFLPVPGQDLVGEGDAAPQHVRRLVAEGYRKRSAGVGILELRRAEAPAR